MLMIVLNKIFKFVNLSILVKVSYFCEELNKDGTKNLACFAQCVCVWGGVEGNKSSG